MKICVSSIANHFLLVLTCVISLVLVSENTAETIDSDKPVQHMKTADISLKEVQTSEGSLKEGQIFCMTDVNRDRMIQRQRQRRRKKRYAYSKISDGSPLTWDSDRVTWAITRPSSQVDEGKQRRMVREALAKWSAVTPLTFVEVGQNQVPDVDIIFARGQHGPDGDPVFDGRARPGRPNKLGHAWGPGTVRSNQDGDVHFDEDDDWTDELKFMGVAVHELGHSLGLMHSKDAEAIMFPAYRATSDLSADDIRGAQFLYGGKGGSKRSKRPPTRPPTLKPYPPRRRTTRRPTLRPYPPRRRTTMPPTLRPYPPRRRTTMRPTLRPYTSRRRFTMRPTLKPYPPRRRTTTRPTLRPYTSRRRFTMRPTLRPYPPRRRTTTRPTLRPYTSRRRFTIRPTLTPYPPRRCTTTRPTLKPYPSGRRRPDDRWKTNRRISKNKNRGRGGTIRPPRPATNRPIRRTNSPRRTTVSPAEVTTLNPDSPCLRKKIKAIVEDPFSDFLGWYYVIMDDTVHHIMHDGSHAASISYDIMFPGAAPNPDVVFSLPEKKSIYVIKNQQMWQFKREGLVNGKPTSLRNMDFPESPSLALTMSDVEGNRRIYLLGKRYWWGLEVDSLRKSRHYDISLFSRDFPQDFDFAAQWSDGMLYAVTQTRYVVIDLINRRRIHGGPLQGRPEWLSKFCQSSSSSRLETAASTSLLVVLIAAIVSHFWG